jgi:hypothetical protein
MITINTVRTGRKWNGRRLYRITIDSRIGTVSFHNRTRNQVFRDLSALAIKLLAEERPYKITGITTF